MIQPSSLSHGELLTRFTEARLAGKALALRSEELEITFYVVAIFEHCAIVVYQRRDGETCPTRLGFKQGQLRYPYAVEVLPEIPLNDRELRELQIFQERRDYHTDKAGSRVFDKDQTIRNIMARQKKDPSLDEHGACGPERLQREAPRISGNIYVKMAAASVKANLAYRKE